MVLRYLALSLWLGVLSTGQATEGAPSASNRDVAGLVNLFIGTTNGGHVFPGATLPHGMAKAGMDTDSPGNQAGYDADPQYHAVGFSQLHDDGTGGGASLSNFKLWPYASCEGGFTGCPTSLESRGVLRKVLPDGSADDAASPGYFSTNLTTDIRVELTTTRRTAIHRYTFPPGTTTPRINVDIYNDGQRFNLNPVVNIDPLTGRVTGSGTFFGSFGPGTYPASVCVDFKGEGFKLTAPSQFGVYSGSTLAVNATSLDGIGFGGESGALLGFPPHPGNSTPTVIVARVGVSLISPAQACSNAESEVPDFDFGRVQKEARATWNDLLGRIQVDTQGVDTETTVLLYSSLYRTHIVPADYTDENPLWNSTEPYFDSLYCNWDTYRTLYPLFSLHDPVTFSRIVRGMINIQQHEGWLPECRSSTVQQYVQGSSDADPILGEFFIKFYRQAASLGVSAEDLYAALVVDAENQPPNWDLQGRQTTLWKQYGFLPFDLFGGGGTNTRHVSRALEYAFGDFAISQVAKLLGKKDDAQNYTARAGNFVNNWDPDVSLPGADNVTGFMQLRNSDGSFTLTDPRHCSVNDPTRATCYLDGNNHDGFYESSPFVYSQYVPQDTAKLIELQGGTKKFIDRLNIIFEQDYFDSTDEPSQQIPFMYHYANRPGLSTQRSRQIISTDFNTTRSGLPGNDDSGAMGSYAFFYLAGLYPVPATRQYLLSSPYFPRITFSNPLYNKTATIIAKNFKGNPASGIGGTVFVKGVRIDGKPWKSNCYLEFDAFAEGSTIELDLTDDITQGCGVGTDALPPSLSSGGFL